MTTDKPGQEPPKQRRKTAVKTAARNRHRKKVKQEHGGALLTGGVPGNKGGPGRPRSAIRDLSALAFEQRIPVLEEIADDKDQKPSDRIRAVDTLGKHGGIGHEDRIDRELIRRLAEDVQAVIRSGQFAVEYMGELEEDVPGPEDELLQHVYERWAMTLGAHQAGDQPDVASTQEGICRARRQRLTPRARSVPR